MNLTNSHHIFPNQYFIDMCLYQYGYEQCKPQASFGPFIRNHYLFHYVISGSGTLIATNSSGVDQTFHVKSGQGFMIFPGQNTHYFADREHPWEYTWIEFDGVRVEEVLLNSGISINQPIYRTTDKGLSVRLKDTMLDMSFCDEPRSQFATIGKLYECMDYMVRSAKDRKSISGERLSDAYIKEAVHFIEQNFQNDITVEDIAAFCNISRGYLCRLLKKHTGKSPQQLLLSYRMSKAAQLLQLTRLSVGEIGEAVGYTNQLHFSRAFKNTYGMSPVKWRQENHHVER